MVIANFGLPIGEWFSLRRSLMVPVILWVCFFMSSPRQECLRLRSGAARYGGNPFEGIDGEVEIKQCWLCESEGERKFTQAEVDEFIYEMYYKK